MAKMERTWPSLRERIDEAVKAERLRLKKLGVPTHLHQIATDGWPGEPSQGIVELFDDKVIWEFVRRGWDLDWSPLSCSIGVWAIPPGRLTFWGVPEGEDD